MIACGTENLGSGSSSRRPHAQWQKDRRRKGRRGRHGPRLHQCRHPDAYQRAAHLCHRRHRGPAHAGAQGRARGACGGSSGDSPEAHGHGKFLGGGMVGTHAGDMIGAVALAVGVLSPNSLPRAAVTAMAAAPGQVAAVQTQPDAQSAATGDGAHGARPLDNPTRFGLAGMRLQNRRRTMRWISASVSERKTAALTRCGTRCLRRMSKRSDTCHGALVCGHTAPPKNSSNM